MSFRLLVSVVLLTSAGVRESGDPELHSNGDEAFPLALCMVPEMSYIPEVDDWEFCAADKLPEHMATVRKDWKGRITWATKHITPELARSLSRWARPQMGKYKTVPPLEKAELKLVRQHPRGNKLVYEATVDTLPSHAPLVTRWLKVYLLYDTGSKSILRMTVTIRGQRLE